MDGAMRVASHAVSLHSEMRVPMYRILVGLSTLCSTSHGSSLHRLVSMSWAGTTIRCDYEESQRAPQVATSRQLMKPGPGQQAD